jgi:hypothetical protein
MFRSVTNEFNGTVLNVGTGPRSLTSLLIHLLFNLMKKILNSKTSKLCLTFKSETRFAKMSWKAAFKKRFPNSPISYSISFLLLHEVTAIVPFPLVFSALYALDISPPGDVDLILSNYNLTNSKDKEKAENFANRIATKFFTPDNTKIFMQLVTTYAIVKLMFPVRIALSAYLTPSVANRFIEPMLKRFKRFK